MVAKITLQEFPVFTLGFLRFGLACLLIAPFFLLEINKEQDKKVKIDLKDIPILFLTGALMTTFNIVFFYEGLIKTTAINASVLTMFVPIMSVLGGWWFLKEKIYLVNLVGIAVGLGGALVVIGLPLLLVGTLPSSDLTGNILLIISDVAYAAGALLTKELLKKYSTLVLVAIMFFVGFITFAIPAIKEIISNPTWVSNITILGILGLLYIAVLSSVCAYFLFEWGLGKIDFIQANLITYIEPAIAASIAVPVLGERISYSFIVGTILIVLGVYWGTLGKQEHHHPHHKHLRA